MLDSRCGREKYRKLKEIKPRPKLDIVKCAFQKLGHQKSGKSFKTGGLDLLCSIAIDIFPTSLLFQWVLQSLSLPHPSLKEVQQSLNAVN